MKKGLYNTFSALSFFSKKKESSSCPKKEKEVPKRKKELPKKG